ncbi:Hypothetical predicted protein [Lecanosticta acicola]|uniref:Uncharacterized protein n=1 Tax=Lecanosticta acicola TaxID=111012 RepID=A0AAI8YT82_9PEZI|nr:Hypothetical predicted protein [Lecanosticta acicola]
MPAVTRSRGQTTLEEKGVSSSKPAPKRKAIASKEPTAKKQRTQPQKAVSEKPETSKDGNEDDGDDTLMINRAPVLELWASSVAHFLHPSLPWTTCLSIGSSVSTLAAISKGRAIGTMEVPDPGEQAEKRAKRAEQQSDLEEVHIMRSHLKLKGGNAVVGDKPKKGNEEALKKKFGDESYEKVKKVMSEALKSWNGKKEDLHERAFHMYEDFRPTVAAGQKGWGRKGTLRLKTIESAVEAG